MERPDGGRRNVGSRSKESAGLREAVGFRGDCLLYPKSKGKLLLKAFRQQEWWEVCDVCDTTRGAFRKGYA